MRRRVISQMRRLRGKAKARVARRCRWIGEARSGLVTGEALTITEAVEVFIVVLGQGFEAVLLERGGGDRQRSSRVGIAGRDRRGQGRMLE